MPHVSGGLLELLAVTRIREVPRDHDGRRLVVVYLQDRALQQVRNEVRAPTVDIADLTNRQAAVVAHVPPGYSCRVNWLRTSIAKPSRSWHISANRWRVFATRRNALHTAHFDVVEDPFQ